MEQKTSIKTNISTSLTTLKAQSFNLEASTQKILTLKQRTAENIIDIGNELIWVKQNLSHGQWFKWVNEYLSFDERTARRFMQVAKNPELLAGSNSLWYKPPKQLKAGESSAFEPSVYNHWFFSGLDKTLGEEYPGNIPGQIALNVVYYYSNEEDLVVDPMAGGGSTIDACKRLNRKCLAYDINIVREDIRYNDIRNGFPSEAKDCQLIFLDPPYYNLLEKRYVASSVSTLRLSDFLDFISRLAIDCYTTVRRGGFVSFLCQNFYHKFASLNDGYTNFGIEAYKRFTNADFQLINEINCPQTSQVYSPSDVQLAKTQKGMLNLVRDLLVFRKI